MKEKRVSAIKRELASVGLSQGDVARELNITTHAMNFWVHEKMTSRNIREWFRNKFGDSFIEEIEA